MKYVIYEAIVAAVFGLICALILHARDLNYYDFGATALAFFSLFVVIRKVGRA